MKKTAQRMFCMVCAALFANLIMLTVKAEMNSVYQAACDEQGEMWSLAILVHSGNQVYAYTNLASSRAEEQNYLFDVNNETAYGMNAVESVENISSWQVENYDGESLLEAAPPKKGEPVRVFYVNSEGKTSMAERKTQKIARQFDDGSVIIELDTKISDMDESVPGILLNEDTECVGVMCAYQIGAYVAWFDEDVFDRSETVDSEDSKKEPADGTEGESSDDKEETEPAKRSTDLPDIQEREESGGIPWPAIIAGTILGVGIWYYLKKKRAGNANEPAAISDQNNNRMDSVGETEPLPPPPVIAHTEAPQGLDLKGELFLVCSGGHMDGRIYPIDTDNITMGRDVSCKIKYPPDYSGISRQHATLYRKNGALTLTDTSSTGTYLKRINGKIAPNQPMPVDVGDVFYLGERKNRFEIVRR